MVDQIAPLRNSARQNHNFESNPQIKIKTQQVENQHIQKQGSNPGPQNAAVNSCKEMPVFFPRYS